MSNTNSTAHFAVSVLSNLVGWSYRRTTAERDTDQSPAVNFQVSFFLWGESTTLLTVWEELRGKALADAPLLHTRHAHRNRDVLPSRTNGRTFGSLPLKINGKKMDEVAKSNVDDSAKHQFVLSSILATLEEIISKTWLNIWTRLRRNICPMWNKANVSGTEKENDFSN